MLILDRTLTMVHEFHTAFEVPVLDAPAIPPAAVSLIRGQLIGEESAELNHGFAARSVLEVIDALTDIQYVIDGTYLSCGLHECKPSESAVIHMITPMDCRALPPEQTCLFWMSRLYSSLGQLLEALVDCDVEAVAQHLFKLQFDLWICTSVCGLWHVKDAAFDEVHRSNMSKLGEDGKPIKNAAGRVVKGPRYFRPDLQRILDLPRIAA
jgi:hypothetical protein